MIWPAMLFNLCVGLLFAAFLLRGVRRYEHRMDAFMARMDTVHAERMRKLDAEHEEFRASLREGTDRFIAEFLPLTPADEDSAIAQTNGFHTPEAHDANSPRLDSSTTP
jgi:hypothetical protein